MKLITTSFFSGLTTIIRVSAGFIAIKAIAMIAGPTGIALVGAFTNFTTIVLTFANGATNIGVVKYTAQYEQNTPIFKVLFSTSFKISLYCSFFIGLLLCLFSNFFSGIVFKTGDFNDVIIALGVSLSFYAFNALFISILNGKKLIKKFTIINISNSIIGLILTVVLVSYFGLTGALYALVLSQAVVFVVTAILIFKSDWFSFSLIKGKFDNNIAVKLGKYSLMAVVSAATVPVSQIILRNLITNRLDIESAGYWQGMMRISDGYLLVATTALSTYYLPKLSSIKRASELRKEIIQGYKVLMPIVVFGCVIVYFFRKFIIKLLYTESFLPMENLFFWQLAGDFFKISVYILGFLMLAKAMTKVFIIHEILSTFSYLLLVHFLLNHYGLKGAPMGLAINYFFSLIAMIIVFRKLLFSKKYRKI